MTSDSPSQKIGGTVKREAGVKVTHNVPMLSIEDVFSEDAVCAWIDKVHAIHPDCTFSVETKIDGLSMSLRYVKEADGKLHLQLAETRGDGLIGEDVTANARVVGDVLQVIDLPYDSLELRGEVYMSHEDFEKYNEEQAWKILKQDFEDGLFRVFFNQKEYTSLSEELKPQEENELVIIRLVMLTGRLW